MSDSILVTGAAGYVGAVLVEKLLKRGYKVVALDNLLFGEESLLPFLENPDFTLIRGDVLHIEDVAKALSLGVSSIIDLAAFVGDAMCNLNEAETINVNLEATKVLVELSKRYKVGRFIFASTCSVYEITNSKGISEDSPVNPLSLYAKTKLDSENIILQMKSTVPCILRLATIYGPSRRMRFDLVVNILTAKAETEGKIVVYGGNQWRPLIHVEDVADAFILCLDAEKDKISHQIFNVGSSEQNYTINQLAEIFKKCFPSLVIDSVEENVDQRSYNVDFTKIKSGLNFVTKKTIIDGIQEIRMLFENNTIKDYKAKKYYNVNYEYL